MDLYNDKLKIGFLIPIFAFFSGVIILFIWTMKTQNAYLLCIGSVLISGSFYYLVSKKNRTLLNICSGNRNSFRTTIIAVFSLIICSNYIISVSLLRPLSYFIIISLIIALMAIMVFSCCINYRIYLVLALFSIFLVNFLIRTHIYLNYGGMIGVDPWAIRLFIEDIIANGMVLDSAIGSKYSIFLGMQLYSSISSIIVGVPAKEGMFISVTLSLIGASIFIYLITKKLMNRKIALISVLLFGVAEFTIAYSVQVCAWSFGIPIFAIGLFVLFSEFRYRNCFFIVIIILLTVIHPITIVIFLVVVIVLYFFQFLLRRTLISAKLFAISICVPFLYWGYMSFGVAGNSNILKVVLFQLKRSIIFQGGFLNRIEVIEGVRTITQDNNLFFESILNITGFSIFIGLGLLGALYLFSYSKARNISYGLIFSTAIIFFIPFSFGLFGLRNVMNYRWFVFGYVPLAVLAAIGLFFILAQTNKKTLQIVVIGCIMFCFAFFMVTSIFSNLDNPLYYKDATTRFSFTKQELSLQDELLHYYDGPIICDGTYYRALQSGSYNENSEIQFYKGEYCVYEDIIQGNVPNALFIWRFDYSTWNNIVPLYAKRKENSQNLSKKYSDFLQQQEKIYANGLTNAYFNN